MAHRRRRAACEQEAQRYRTILSAAEQLSTTREQAKADLITQLSRKHRRVIAFDHHLITLSAIRQLIDKGGTPVIVATGADKKNRKEVERVFAPDSHAHGITLCSDAMNEGLNLQGASAMVHFDVPTTLRVAEQRVGRVDRMDSRHDAIEVYWPRDGLFFATRANELLAARTQESSSLLGSNLNVPNLAADRDDVVAIEEHITTLEADRDEAWDGIRDALTHVRRLVEGPDALIFRRVYEEHRTTTHRVLARVSPVRSTTPWAFFAVIGVGHGAPRWIMFEGKDAQPVIGLENIVEPLRRRLSEDPPSLPFDPTCEEWLNRYLTVATRFERLLLPRRLLRALDQMSQVTGHWAANAARRGDPETSERWKNVGALAAPSDETHPDPYLVAERWLELVQPLLVTRWRDPTLAVASETWRGVAKTLTASGPTLEPLRSCNADMSETDTRPLQPRIPSLLKALNKCVVICERNVAGRQLSYILAELQCLDRRIWGERNDPRIRVAEHQKCGVDCTSTRNINVACILLLAMGVPGHSTAG